MKPFLFSLLIAGAAQAPASAAFTTTTTGAPPVPVYAVSRVGEHIETGTPRAIVQLRLGNPTKILSENTWVYRSFQPLVPHRAARDYRTVVITFRQDNVSAMHLVNREGLAALANLEQNAGAAQVSSRD